MDIAVGETVNLVDTLVLYLQQIGVSRCEVVAAGFLMGRYLVCAGDRLTVPNHLEMGGLLYAGY